MSLISIGGIMKSIKLVCLVLFFVASLLKDGLCGQASITISYNDENGKANKMVLGNNLLGQTVGVRGDYGYGAWDPELNKFVNKAMDLLEEAKIAVLRFPGGGGASNYDWKLAIDKDRESFLFGIDEFLKVCETVKAEPVFTVAYFTGDENDAADLVEYLNAEVGSNPNGGIDWAKKRADNGHSSPYNFKYFEIGNEVYHSKELEYGQPETYSNRYLKYYEAMKKVDGSIKIGVVLKEWQNTDWNKPVLEVIIDKIDFGILHIYPTPVWGDAVSTIPAKEIFTTSLAQPITKYEPRIQETLALLKKYAGKDVPIAITEFNGGFAQDKPVPYRHCLGNALVNAELLRIFMKPENNILMANNWNFCNEYWGMVSNGFKGNPDDLYNAYVKRPNYYVFEMYAKCFGDILIETDVRCDSYKYNNQNIPYLSVNASKTTDGKKITLMVVNKNLTDPEEATISLSNFTPYPDGCAWVLNGPSVDATNEANPNNVTVSYTKINIDSSTFKYTFAPHSFTALEIFKAEGGSTYLLPQSSISKSSKNSSTSSASVSKSASSSAVSKTKRKKRSISINDNKPPVASSLSVAVESGRSAEIVLVAKDNEKDLLRYSITKRPEHGTLEGFPPRVTYVPESGYAGSDSFLFKANDGMSDSNVGNVTISVQPAVVKK